MQPADLELVLQKLRSQLGNDFSGYRESTLQRRLQRRLSATRCACLSAYLQHLDDSPDEFQLLLRDLTIKYTEFFRDPELFDLLRNETLPEILDAKTSCEPLRMWSAGCSTGEEVYSLASAAACAVAWRDDDHRKVEILGTDIDCCALDVAARGQYIRAHYARPLPEMAPEHFEDDGAVVSPRPCIRQMVDFRVHDLVDAHAEARIRELKPVRFDLVMCRNLLIYLQPPLQAVVMKRLFARLRVGGFLVLGPKETLCREILESSAIISRKFRVFRKLRDSGWEAVGGGC